jgi:hypothetical protein
MSDSSSSRRPKPRTDRTPSGGGAAARKPRDTQGGKKPFERKPADGKKPYERKPADGKKPYDRTSGERKPFDRDGKKPFERGTGERRSSFDRSSGERKPYDRSLGERKPYDRTSGERKPYDRSSGERKPFDRNSGERKPYDRSGSGRPPFDRTSRPPRANDDREPRPRHDDPEIPETVAANQLDRGARAELKTLSKDNADWVARHLVMVSTLIDEDAELAHRHALAAARRAGRIAVVRETVGITAYAVGQFELALRELRTYRRISGKDDQLPLMVDSERGVGRPEKALELGRSVPRASLEVPVQVALAIAMSGARLDLGQPEAALVELQIPHLDPERAFSWSPALFDAYATVLEDLGRTEEAEQWWQRSDRASIALERAAIPEGEDTVEIIEEDWDPDAH